MLAEQVTAPLNPRAEANRQALRILFNAREVLERQGTSDHLMLTALLRTVELVGVDARKAITDARITQMRHLRTRPLDDLPARTARTEANRLAVTINNFQRQLI